MKNTKAILSASWLRLAEYGDWPHPRGLQRFTPSAANTMVQYFKSLRGRLSRKFGGLPVYIGHPDDAQFYGKSGHTDTRAYAWVTDLEARRDGLYGAFKWSEAGEELLHNAFYKFLSPRWAMEPLGTDTFQPVRLLSVGLTNQPNIPGEAIANCMVDEAHSPESHGEIHNCASVNTADTRANHANSKGNPAPTTQTNAITHTDYTANAERTTAAAPAIRADATQHAYHSTNTDATQHPDNSTDAAPHADDDTTCLSYRELRSALGIGSEVDPLEAIGELREQSERFYRIACEQSDRLGHESASLSNARREQIHLVVQNALLCGRIAPHEAAGWQQNLETDWDTAQAALSSRSHSLKTTAIANTRPPAASATSNTDDFLARVEAHAKANDLNFAEAWCDLKRRQPDLYRQFFATDS